MRTTNASGSTFHWRIWWDTQDEHRRPLIHSDQVRYQNRKDAMRALEQRFNIPPDQVSETRWDGNLSPYMDEP